ncbi:hypothetical protein FRACYDRAFT_237438 [Fragilariopsis cylindrus CCMP1102]|uniref:Uncharacterized protein n=1 Tax=Fragilariopsis cylindrus CCMP1102 TaxID=635003 RepID=A0A1E7FLY5_9STRA|nr:hypothetical protein FRACYDRAFT_237438 [Fragilariopsis cylindrus CCMP1102]|eukprot:OEU19147.1 hypothetical protein FRACYDRAFT_237438 [Fragilariopsis cylindrus CCMP1102]
MHRVDTWTRLWGARYVLSTLVVKGVMQLRTWENGPFGGMLQALLVYFILTICIYGRYLGVETMVQFLSLMLWHPISEWYFWALKYDMLAEMLCLCSGGKNKVGGNYNVLVYYKNASAPDPEGVVMCNTFK